MQIGKDHHGMERNRRFRLALVSSTIVRPITVLIPVLVIPLFLHHLGVKQYAIFETLSAFSAWVSLSAVGLSFGLNNRLIECNVSGDRTKAQTYVSTLFFSMLIILFIGTILTITVSLFVDWPRVLNLKELVPVNQMRTAVFTAIIIPLCGVTINFAPSIYSAYQEIHYQNIWDGASRILTIAFCLMVPAVNGGIATAIFALSGIPVIVGIVNLFYLFMYSKPWLCPHQSLFTLRYLIDLLQDGSTLLLLQSAVAITFQTDRIIISVLRSPTEVAQYALLNRIFLVGYGAFFLVIAPLWPAYGEAVRRGDTTWCKRKLALSSYFGALGLILFGILILAGSRQLISILDIKAIGEIPRFAIVGMTGAFAIRAWSDSHAILLNGAGVLRPQLALLGATTALTITLNLVFTREFGIVGTAWSYPIAATLSVAWAYPWLVRKYILNKPVTQ